MTPLVLENRIPANRAAFADKVREIAGKLRCDPNWLMCVMWLESGLQSTAKNPLATATGLIQFIESTAKSLGTTTAALAQMSSVRQLDYVYLYFKPYTGKIKSCFDLYLITFYPAAIGKPDSYLIGTAGNNVAQVARLNPGFDVNKDGKITKGEFEASCLKRLPAEAQTYLANQKKSV